MYQVLAEPIRRLESAASPALGLFTRDEAIDLGVTGSQIKYHCRPGGRWTRLLPGVYSLRDQPPDVRRPFLAALLWAGADAVVSHRAAAAVLNLDGIRGPMPEIWSAQARARPGLIVHRGSVPGADVITSGPLRLTSMPRTVVDLAAVTDDDTLELALESVLRRDRATLGALAGAAATDRQGAVRLRRVLARRPAGCVPTDSELETRFVQILRTTDLPPPVRQFVVIEDGRTLGRLDVCWPDAGVWVELDGRAWHDRPEALLYDRQRQNDLAVRLGWLILRFTWVDVVRRPTATAQLTARAYHQRAAGLLRPSG